jgi:hypothetical protein
MASHQIFASKEFLIIHKLYILFFESFYFFGKEKYFEICITRQEKTSAWLKHAFLMVNKLNDLYFNYNLTFK